MVLLVAIVDLHLLNLTFALIPAPLHLLPLQEIPDVPPDEHDDPL